MNRHDWAAVWGMAKCCVVALALLAAALSVGGCVIEPWGYGGGGYHHEHRDGGYYQGGYGRGY